MDPTRDQRAIFEYYDGAQQVWGDPLAIHRQLTVALGGHPNRWIEAARGGDELARAQAEDRLNAAVRQAFAMQPFDPATGQGAADEDCRQALRAYSEFLEKKNPSTAIPPSSSPPSEGGSGPSVPLLFVPVEDLPPQSLPEGWTEEPLAETTEPSSDSGPTWSSFAPPA